MSKHTPGQWTHYDDSEQHVHRHQIAAMGKTVAHIYCTKSMEAEDAANARLIAAAPDLLEALEAALEWIDSVPSDIQLPTMPGFDRDWVNGVLAKAKGEQQ